MNELAIIEPATCRMVYVSKIMKEPCYAIMPAGQSLQEMLGPEASHSLRVTIGGLDVSPTIWAKVRPKAGTHICVELYPQGGGARKWILTIIAIVATVFTMGAASGAAWALVGGLSATTVVIGGALIACLAIAMIPPPAMPTSAAAGGAVDQLKSLTGTSNNAAPYAAIPFVAGSWVLHPPHAALPYTEIAGEDQYLRMLLDLGLGDLDVSDIKIGGTPIDSYNGVEYEISPTPTLFNQDIYELQVATNLNDNGDTDTRTTQSESTEISLDIVFGNGLFGSDAKGNATKGIVDFHVEYRATGSSGAWSSATTAHPTFAGGFYVNGGICEVTSSKRETLRGNIRWKVAKGQYDVRVTRTGENFPGNAALQGKSGDSQWTVLRSINPQVPSTTGTLKLAVRIKATDQLSGVVSTLTARVAQRVRRWDYNSQSFLPVVASQNPAWIYLWLLTECPAMTRHVPLSMVDINGISRWAADCDDKGLTYSGAIDSTRIASELFKDVLACGLATFGIKAGLYSVVRDIPQAVPMQVYTPLSGTSLKWSRVFTAPPHALRVSFTNTEADNQQDEVVVYWDGYSAANATHYELLSLKSVDNPVSAWVLARYHLAVMWLRPNIYTQEVDIESLISERGDLVEVSGPVIGWGVAYGRVVEVLGTGDVHTIRLSEPLKVEAGASYAMRLRNSNAYSDYSLLTIDPDDIVDGYTSIVTATSVMNAGARDNPELYLYVIGEVNNVTFPAIISAITPGTNMVEHTATLTLVDANPGIWTAIEGTPPPFVSSINGKPWCSPPNPPVVHIRAGSTGPDTGGTVKQVTGVSPAPTPGIYRVPLYSQHGGGGAVGGCPCVDELVQRVKNGVVEEVRAGDIVVGDTLRGADPVTLEVLDHVVTDSAPETQPCVVLETADGHTLACSSTAPIPDSEGKLPLAPNCYGHRIAVQSIAGAAWDRVEHVRGIGPRTVQHISISDGCFWASGILHHNKLTGAKQL